MPVRPLTAQERAQQQHVVRPLTEQERAVRLTAPASTAILFAHIESLPHERAGELATIEFTVVDRSSTEAPVHHASGRHLIDPLLRIEISGPAGDLLTPTRERTSQGCYQLHFMPPRPGGYTLAIHLPGPAGQETVERFSFTVS